jgi:hypothetical protein
MIKDELQNKLGLHMNPAHIMVREGFNNKIRKFGGIFHGGQVRSLWKKSQNSLILFLNPS